MAAGANEWDCYLPILLTIYLFIYLKELRHKGQFLKFKR